MAERFGGDGPPVLQPYPLCDYATGVSAAYGVALALLHRQLSGEGQHVRTALTYTATTLQAPFLDADAGEPRGQRALGLGTFQRLYRASDGWLYLGAGEPTGEALRRLAAVPGLEALATTRPQDCERLIEGRLATEPADTWVSRLIAARIGAQRVVDLDALTADATVRAQGLVLTREHPASGFVDTVGPAPRLSRTPVTLGRPAGPPGADARSVLEEAGLGASYEELVERGVVAVPGRAGQPPGTGR
jgi:crotonobetainyl-CoA:carnitine CoA-transferase CaiB-like acyl-CoA transferase